MPHRSDPVLFWDEANWAALCKRCHDAKTAREGRWGWATAASLIPAPGGGEVSSKEAALQGPGAPRLCVGREIQEGGIRPLSGGTPEFLPATARQFVALS